MIIGVTILGLYILLSMFSSESNCVEVKTSEVTIDSITQKVSASGNVITVNNEGSLGNYIITLSNNPDLTDLSLFSTFV